MATGAFAGSQTTNQIGQAERPEPKGQKGETMNSSLSRRKFLSSAACASAAALLPSGAMGLASQKAGKAAAAAGSDTAVEYLTSAAVAKVQWKAKPFPMPERPPAAQLLEGHDGAESQLPLLAAQ